MSSDLQRLPLPFIMIQLQLPQTLKFYKNVPLLLPRGYMFLLFWSLNHFWAVGADKLGDVSLKDCVKDAK